MDARVVERRTYQSVVAECVALPGVPEVIFAENAVDLHIPSGMVDGVDGISEEVQNEAEHVQVTICRRPRVKDKVRDVFIPMIE